ncbi:AI-2E family transporter [Comamonas suwonensis]|uniref:hypothetical protein n=1 Tax=Comamonas suwonensis TaxID=2606214 RepID=UPI00145E3E43|nr:hypothetical protein [Comamonas suwonensis]MBI1623951.1 hypothetical protein [Comamonas suwonensis]
MNQSIAELKQQRLNKLFDDCQQQVISQIIGPFGLSTAMFEDRNGGNVTTLHNFKREDSDYVATNSDKKLHAQSKKKYDEAVRSGYEVKKKEQAKGAGEKVWEDLRQDKIKQGQDEYTGRNVSADGKVELKDGRIVGVDLDHVVSVKEIHGDPKIHLALGQDKGEATADVTRIREVANSDENLALTNMSANRSKGEKDLKEWSEEKRKDGSTNAEKFDLDEQLVEQKYQEAKKHINDTANKALLKKQTTELLQSGGAQAVKQGMCQALGLLLTELVNGLFNEFKVLIKHGVEAGKTLFGEIRERLARVIDLVVKKIPDAVSQMFQGGVSGFMSNLLTFLINSFLSTAKRFVTVIREGLLGLFRAFKMIFFPPTHMTSDQALQEGLKILTAVVITSVGLLLTETMGGFMATVPFLKPFADLITPVLIGIMTGLLSAFLAYQIDCLFDRYRNSQSEKFIDELLTDAKRRDEFATELVALSETSLGNIENYSKSISLYQSIGVTLGAAGTAAAATLASLEQTVVETGEQVAKSFAMIDFINESQSEIDDFLKTL